MDSRTLKSIRGWPIRLSDRLRLVLSWSAGIGLSVAIATGCWFPALFAHQTIIQGDFSLIDVPFADLQMRAMQGDTSLLWASGTYGGHPLFAEGQGGFAHPLNLLWALLITPTVGVVQSANLIHWLLMALGGIGMFGLCRSLGAGIWSSLFGVIVLVLSPIWTMTGSVLPVAGTLTWVPWSLWAFEGWIRRPSLVAASLLGLSCALLILAGYPQGLHGTILYMTVSLLVVPFQRDARRAWVATWRRRLGTMLTAIVLCVGLAAVQLLPLFQLVGLSHRGAGTPLLFQVPVENYVRGLFFTVETAPALIGAFFSSAGSLLVCVVAAFVLLVPRPARINGHILATFVLLQLGFGRASWFFNFAYDHDLIPGLHFFRVVHLYLDFAALGLALLSVFAIEGLVGWARNTCAAPHRARWARGAGAVLILVAFGWVVTRFYLPAIPLSQVAVAVGALVGMLPLLAGRARFVPAFLVAMLVIDCAATRLQPFRFFAPTALEDPEAVQAIEQISGWRDFKIYDDSLSRMMGLLPAQTPDLEARIRYMLTAVPAMTNMAAGLNSLNGALALPLARRAAIEQQIHDEVHGQATTKPGRRLIDILGVRFATLDQPTSAAAFRTLRPQSPNSVWLGENTAALPRFQIYSHHRIVGSTQEALSALKTADGKLLVLEPSSDQGSIPEDASEEEDGVQMRVLDASSTLYRIGIETRSATWLFLADANYPGWSAQVDGVETPVYTAQILGKAVSVPSGAHEIVIRYTSRPFRWGLSVSIGSLGLMLAIILRAVSRRRRVLPI